MVTADAIARRVADHLGFALSSPQQQRLQRTVDRLGAGRPGTVAAEAVPGTSTFEALVESVLVGETYWFRDAAQLDAVANVLAGLPADGRRVWCAGTATGQEAWSLAITLHRAGVWPVEVVASDISRGAVRAAQVAAYPLARQRGLDPATAAAYGTIVDGLWSPRGDLRQQVTVVNHDLLRDPPFPAPVIMCRNVLIYLTPRAIAQALRQFDRGLAPGGTLLLGHSETQLPGPGWRTARLGGTFAFTRAADTDRPPTHTVTPTAAPPLRPAPRSSPAAAPALDGPSTVDHAVDAAEADALVRAGEQALAGRAHDRAIGLLRQARYLRDRDPVPAVLLGMALARAGHIADARRSWAVARSLLDGVPDGTGLLGGYPPAAVRRWVQDLLDGNPT